MASSPPDAPSNNPLKNLLAEINAYFRAKSQQPVFAPPEVRLKIERGNGFAKNFMRLCNKTMIGLNRIHISRGKLFAGFVGMGIGYLCSEGEEAFVDFQRNYRPAIKSALIQQVLRNEQVKRALNATLLQNVYTNREIQYTLHEVLDWKAIRPQMDSLFRLSKQALLAALRHPQTLTSLSAATAQALSSNQDIVTKVTLDLLEGQQLRGLVVREIGVFLRSQLFYQLLAKEIASNAKHGLEKVQNRDGLYLFCRQNFLNW